jgi:hypothetical protein
MTWPTGAFERLLVGFLIDLDRERAEVRKHHQAFAGIRTFSLIALAGTLPMLVVDTAGSAPVVACSPSVRPASGCYLDRRVEIHLTRGTARYHGTLPWWRYPNAVFAQAPNVQDNGTLDAPQG